MPAPTQSLQSSDDLQLLRAFHRTNAQDAFTELLRRHLNLVYATALRSVGGDRHLAEEVAQHVFADLARKAASLDAHTFLAGWLYRAARFAAAQAVRSERRRKTYEKTGYAMHALNAAPSVNWDEVRPFIDDALNSLAPAEREVILLRYFENRAFADIGRVLAVSPDGARMRADRALEKVRVFLERRGLTSTSVALAAAFVHPAGIAAPATLTGTILTSVLTPATVVTGAAITSASVALPIAMGKLVLGTAAALVGIGIITYATLQTPTESPGTAPSPVTATTPSDSSLTRPAFPPSSATVTGASSVAPASFAKPAPTDDRNPTITAGQNSVTARVNRLDSLVKLSAAQRAAATDVFSRELDGLEAFSPGEERLQKGIPIRKHSRDEIAKLLSPAQLELYVTTPQRLGGGATHDPAAEASRVDKVVSLSDEQTLRVASIYQRQAEALQALAPGERDGDKGRLIRRTAQADVRAVLTPGQQVKFDANPNGSDELEEYAKLLSVVRSLPGLRSRLGTLQRVLMQRSAVMTSSSHLHEHSQAKKGTITYDLRGTAGSEVITVQWQRTSPAEPVTILQITDSRGRLIPHD